MGRISRQGIPGRQVTIVPTLLKTGGTRTGSPPVRISSPETSRGRGGRLQQNHCNRPMRPKPGGQRRPSRPTRTFEPSGKPLFPRRRNRRPLSGDRFGCMVAPPPRRLSQTPVTHGLGRLGILGAQACREALASIHEEGLGQRRGARADRAAPEGTARRGHPGCATHARKRFRRAYRRAFRKGGGKCRCRPLARCWRLAWTGLRSRASRASPPPPHPPARACHPGAPAHPTRPRRRPSASCAARASSASVQ